MINGIAPSTRLEVAKQRRSEAFDLHRSGASLYEIARLFGVSYGGAREMVRKAMRESDHAAALAQFRLTAHADMPVNELPVSRQMQSRLRELGYGALGQMLAQDREMLLDSLFSPLEHNRKERLGIHALLNLVQPGTTRKYEPHSQGFRALIDGKSLGPWRSDRSLAVNDAIRSDAAFLREDGRIFLADGCRIDSKPMAIDLCDDSTIASESKG